MKVAKSQSLRERITHEVASSSESGQFFNLEITKGKKRKREDNVQPDAELRMKTERGWIAKGKQEKKFV